MCVLVYVYVCVLSMTDVGYVDEQVMSQGEGLGEIDGHRPRPRSDRAGKVHFKVPNSVVGCENLRLTYGHTHS